MTFSVNLYYILPSQPFCFIDLYDGAFSPNLNDNNYLLFQIRMKMMMMMRTMKTLRYVKKLAHLCQVWPFLDNEKNNYGKDQSTSIFFGEQK